MAEAPPPYAPPSSRSPEERLANLRQVVNELEISIVTVEELRALEAFDIVFICDDSGSMATADVAGTSGDAFAPKRTRWDELKDTVAFVVRLAAALDDDGIDVYFLNREGVKNVTQAVQLREVFGRPPGGYTPLTYALRRVLSEKASSERKLLLVIATDGEPSDSDKGPDNAKQFGKALRDRNCDKVYVSILACTDDDGEIGYLNKLDREVKHVDVVDDFVSERKEVLRARPGSRFTKGDYVAKALLGPVMEKWDTLDDAGHHGHKKGGGCVVS